MADEHSNTPRRSTRAPKPDSPEPSEPKSGQTGAPNPETGKPTGSADRLAAGAKFEPKGKSGTGSGTNGTDRPTPVNGGAGKAPDTGKSGKKEEPKGKKDGTSDKTPKSNDKKDGTPDKTGGKLGGDAGKKPQAGADALAGKKPGGKSSPGSGAKLADGNGKPDRAKVGAGADTPGGANKDQKGDSAKGDKNTDDPKKKGDDNNATPDKGDDAKGGGKAAAAGGAKDKAKSNLKGSNATGVDYSDKGLKDQLEHQAADVAMDATPILGQINSARKALKDANKKKKEATGNQDSDDPLDKLEEGTDKVVDGGIKGAKYAIGGAVGGAAGIGAASMLMLMKTLMMLKAMFMGVLGKIAGFIAGIVQAVGSAVSAVLGVTTAMGNIVAVAMIGAIASVVGGLGIMGSDVLTNKDTGVGACLPETKAVTEMSQEYVEGGGEVDLLLEESAGKLWSVYSAIGGSKEQTAAVLGNLRHESGLDPTSVETILDEPYSLGPKKQAATKANFDIHAINDAYGNKYPAIKQAGIGLAQWTNGRNTLLVKYAKDKSLPWHEFDTQIGFMLAGDEPSRQGQLKDFLAATPGNIDVETERFMNSWIGLSTPNQSLGARQEYAQGFLFTLERATADTAYAEGILSGLNVNRGEGNAASGAFHHDDGCGDAIASHYAGTKAEDGTGEVPSGLTLTPWTRETLPESLKEFYVDPELSGLAWGNGTGWASNIYPGQCVGFSSSYFMQLYPDWNKDGRGTSRPTGNGKFTAGGWANHYGAKTVATPATGSVFSNVTSSVYGHTGIVQHVFANGDILIAEQNIRGASGDANGQQHSWSWRVMKADRYTQDKWEFFKPEGADPRWEKPKGAA